MAHWLMVWTRIPSVRSAVRESRKPKSSSAVRRTAGTLDHSWKCSTRVPRPALPLDHSHVAPLHHDDASTPMLQPLVTCQESEPQLCTAVTAKRRGQERVPVVLGSHNPQRYLLVQFDVVRGREAQHNRTRATRAAVSKNQRPASSTAKPANNATADDQTSNARTTSHHTRVLAGRSTKATGHGVVRGGTQLQRNYCFESDTTGIGRAWGLTEHIPPIKHRNTKFPLLQQQHAVRDREGRK